MVRRGQKSGAEPMSDRLNYHHLLYFWVVAREGGLVAAGF